MSSMWKVPDSPKTLAPNGTESINGRVW